MPRSDPSAETTVLGASTEKSGKVGTPPRRFLLVVGDGLFITHPLPNDGEVVLGRDDACQVTLPHAKISRRHASVRVKGNEVLIEDLGSTNGIRVGGTRLERNVAAPIGAGDSVHLGPYTALVIDEAPNTPRSDDGLARAAVVVPDPTPTGVSELVARIAKNNVSVLIQGETGTGKEVLARTLHGLSGRSGSFVGINCAALGEALLESELFGHERGAFTGAVRAKPGLFEVAAKGTILLDEVGDLPPPLQAKLLRALETRQIYRVGGVQPVKLDIRVVAATHRDLRAEVTAGRFRQDLYFRLNGITLELPPLRERRGAIPVLAAQFLAEAAKAAERAAPRFSATALAALARHEWPGNVRELRLVVERAMLLSGDDEIAAHHILVDSSPEVDDAAEPPAAGDDKDRFLAAARACGGNVSAMARKLGTSRSQVRRLAKRFGVDLDAMRGDGDTGDEGEGGD